MKQLTLFNLEQIDDTPPVPKYWEKSYRGYVAKFIFIKHWTDKGVHQYHFQYSIWNDHMHCGTIDITCEDIFYAEIHFRRHIDRSYPGKRYIHPHPGERLRQALGEQLNIEQAATITDNAPELNKLVMEQTTTVTKHSHNASGWVEEYCITKGAAGNQYFYYRYCWRDKGKIRHCHIPGGNALSNLVMERVEKIRNAIAKKTSPNSIHHWLKGGCGKNGTDI